jgi:Protein of unknown function (DUF3307).
MYAFIILCILFAVKHFLADWQFQTTWMVHGKRRSGFRFIPALFIHSLIHGYLTLYIVAAWFSLFEKVPPSRCLVFAGIDAGSHFIIDKLKVTAEFKDWHEFAFYEKGCARDFQRFRLELNFLDQLLHAMVYLLLIYYITLV